MSIAQDGIVGPKTKGALDIANSVPTPKPIPAPGDPGGVSSKSVKELPCRGGHQ